MDMNKRQIKLRMFSPLFHSHKMHLLALLGVFTDQNVGFPYPFK